MTTPTSIGNKSFVKIVARLSDLGYTVSIPIGEGYAYDLVADDGTNLYRVQCKTARMEKNETLVFNCYTVVAVNNGKARYINKRYTGEIDVFAAYSPDTDQVFIVPIEVASGQVCRLRLSGDRYFRRGSSLLAKDFVV